MCYMLLVVIAVLFVCAIYCSIQAVKALFKKQEIVNNNTIVDRSKLTCYKQVNSRQG